MAPIHLWATTACEISEPERPSQERLQQTHTATEEWLCPPGQVHDEARNGPWLVPRESLGQQGHRDLRFRVLGERQEKEMEGKRKEKEGERERGQ